MSRRHHATGPAVSLFPFLAVLLCTMGALLVLLVLFSRAADDGRATQAAAVTESRVADLELARDELAWRLEQLESIRDETVADLSRVRLQLAGIEDDSRKLVDEFESLDETLAALDADDEPSAAIDEARLTELESRLAAARDVLEATRREGAKRPPAYAVIPYEGHNGTRRRPLYIECCIDGVFLQPEGVRLGPADFEGPPGPGNPLASALRAAREHLAMHGDGYGDPDVQPYPLLLVRPSGVMAYYAAREAIVSWGNEFGYQFIDEEWELEFPPADPALAAAETRAVEEARRRLEWLAQVRPPQPARPTKQYRAATTRGGIVAEGGPSVLGDRSRFDWTEDDARSAGDRGRPPNAATGSALGTGGTAGGSGLAAAQPAGRAVGGTGLLGGNPSATAGGDWNAAGSQAGSVAAGGGGDRYAGPSRFYSGHADQGGDGGGAGGAATDGNAQVGSANTRFVSTAGAGDQTGEPGGLAGAAGAAGNAEGQVGGTPGLDGAGGGVAEAGVAGGAASVGGGSGGAASAQGATGGSGGGTSMPGLVGVGAGGQQDAGGASGASASLSLAGSRGSNWASLATHDRPVPLTRPVKLECAANEFRVLGEDGRVEERIPIGTHTADAVDPLVRAVHARVRRWGIAGDRMYWRPELVLTATSDGAGRRDDLERLLADSGLDTRRSQTTTAVRPLPPVKRPGRPWRKSAAAGDGVVPRRGAPGAADPAPEPHPARRLVAAGGR